MLIYLIRHGEPDYSAVKKAGYQGFGRELGSLSLTGIKQAHQAAQNPLWASIELLLASPYPRALQTALELTRNHHFPVRVELGLHEWLPDKNGLATDQTAAAAYQAYQQHGGQAAAGFTYETVTELKSRALTVFQKYVGHYQKIACVTHGELISQLTGRGNVQYCEIRQIRI